MWIACPVETNICLYRIHNTKIKGIRTHNRGHFEKKSVSDLLFGSQLASYLVSVFLLFTSMKINIQIRRKIHCWVGINILQFVICVTCPL